MSAPSGVAVFNFERTIVSGPFSYAASDAGIGLPNHENRFSPENEARNQARLLDWLIGKSEFDIEFLLDATTDRAWNRIAAWAKIVMSKEVSLGNELCIYSATFPEQLLNAYADGVEEAVPDLEIQHVYGRELVEEDGKYTGGRRDLPKTETLEQLEAEDYTIELVADSFGGAEPALRKGKKRLAVNPDYRLREMENTKQIPRLYWHADELMTDVSPAFSQTFRLYDLTDSHVHGAFLMDLGYDIS